ncbi:MAG: MurR/RpiR family transcriptional regulator [Steroidobacteraceae bacterium]
MAKNSSAQPTHLHRYQGLIQQRLTELSTAEQAVAAHLAAHPERLPFETADSLGKRLGVSAMTVGRALKALGYRGLADLRSEMRSEVSGAVPWNRRGASQAPPVLRSLDRTRALRAELEAVEAVHALAETPAWRETVKLVAAARQVFVAGFQTERGLAVAFADQLAYARPGVRFLSVENRGFADLQTEARADSCLVIVDCRRYSRWFRLLGEKAAARGVPLVIVTDAYCKWAAKLTACALQARTDSGRFWDNNAPILSLLNLLVEDVIEQLGDAVHPQLDAASEFGSAFVGFERVPRQRQPQRASRVEQPDAARQADGRRHKGARLRR